MVNYAYGTTPQTPSMERTSVESLFDNFLARYGVSSAESDALTAGFSGHVSVYPPRAEHACTV